ncbi:MAG TPA: hypothetical protein VFW25_01715 [Silvibacterium sp.]|nr:hypothetical protein [Silvibacterium sp.]
MPHPSDCSCPKDGSHYAHHLHQSDEGVRTKSRRTQHHQSVGTAIAFVVAVLFSMLSWHFLEWPILSARAAHLSSPKPWNEQREAAAL